MSKPSLRNQASYRAQGDDKVVTLQVFEVIDSWAWLWGGETARTISETLAAHPDATRVDVEINTDGGDVHEGIAMMSAIRSFADEHGIEVHTHNMGKAFSMGSLLLMAGDVRKMARGADIMAHLPWTVAAGNAAELRDTADILDRKAEDLAQLYNEATPDHGIEQWRAWLSATTWWNAEEGLRDKLIHEITATTAAPRAELRPGDYPNIPPRLLAATPNPEQERPAMAEPDKTSKNETPEMKAQEKARRAGIRACVKLDVSQAKIDAAIDDGTPLAKFQADAIDAWETERPPLVKDHGRAVIVAGDDAQDKMGNALQAAILVRAGMLTRVEAGLTLAAKNNRYTGRTTFDAAIEHRGLTLKEMARLMLETSGVDTSGMTAKQMVGRAFMSGNMAGLLGPNSTSDFPGLLENTLHKVLLAEYELASDTWSRFCGQGTVSDFREHPRYRQGSIQNLALVGEGGEIRNANIPDARREKISADEYGLIVAITRKAIINDDLTAFSRLPVHLGRAAARTIETAVYALLAENGGLGPNMGDGQPLFDATHNNISAGAALSVAALDKDRQLFRSQRDESGNDFLDILPDVLLTPLALGSTARTIIGAQYDSDAGVPNNRTPNKVQNMVRDIVDSPRLDNNGTTDALTRRYLFADPAVNPAIEVVRLAGEMGPSLEGQDGWRVSGREWRVVDDWGVGAVDYRTAVTNKGS